MIYEKIAKSYQNSKITLATNVSPIKYLIYSFIQGEPPILIGVPFHGLCDIRNQDCLRTRIVGYNFVESANLLCRTRQVKVKCHKLYFELESE